MVRKRKITAEETAELQRLYSELPSAIAEAAVSVHTEPVTEDGDEKVDTIIKRICQLSDDSELT
ncbi:MAG TPA: hypothetical protein VGH84_04260 [Steroidobacteraceae bacterium]|jgi:hypothetical protein